MQDKEYGIRLYRGWRNDLTKDETWNIVCSEIDQLPGLIETLEDTEELKQEDPTLAKPLDMSPIKKISSKDLLSSATEDAAHAVYFSSILSSPRFFKPPKRRTKAQIFQDENKYDLPHCDVKLTHLSKQELDKYTKDDTGNKKQQTEIENLDIDITNENEEMDTSRGSESSPIKSDHCADKIKDNLVDNETTNKEETADIINEPDSDTSGTSDGEKDRKRREDCENKNGIKLNEEKQYGKQEKAKEESSVDLKSTEASSVFKKGENKVKKDNTENKVKCQEETSTNSQDNSDDDCIVVEKKVEVISLSDSDEEGETKESESHGIADNDSENSVQSKISYVDEASHSSSDRSEKSETKISQPELNSRSTVESEISPVKSDHCEDIVKDELYSYLTGQEENTDTNKVDNETTNKKETADIIIEPSFDSFGTSEGKKDRKRTDSDGEGGTEECESDGIACQADFSESDNDIENNVQGKNSDVDEASRSSSNRNEKSLSKILENVSRPESNTCSSVESEKSSENGNSNHSNDVTVDKELINTSDSGESVAVVVKDKHALEDENQIVDSVCIVDAKGDAGRHFEKRDNISHGEHDKTPGRNQTTDTSHSINQTDITNMQNHKTEEQDSENISDHSDDERRVFDNAIQDLLLLERKGLIDSEIKSFEKEEHEKKQHEETTIKKSCMLDKRKELDDSERKSPVKEEQEKKSDKDDGCDTDTGSDLSIDNDKKVIDDALKDLMQLEELISQGSPASKCLSPAPSNDLRSTKVDDKRTLESNASKVDLKESKEGVVDLDDEILDEDKSVKECGSDSKEDVSKSDMSEEDISACQADFSDFSLENGGNLKVSVLTSDSQKGKKLGEDEQSSKTDVKGAIKGDQCNQGVEEEDDNTNDKENLDDLKKKYLHHENDIKPRILDTSCHIEAKATGDLNNCLAGQDKNTNTLDSTKANHSEVSIDADECSFLAGQDQITDAKRAKDEIYSVKECLKLKKEMKTETNDTEKVHKVSKEEMKREINDMETVCKVSKISPLNRLETAEVLDKSINNLGKESGLCGKMLKFNETGAIQSQLANQCSDIDRKSTYKNAQPELKTKLKETCKDYKEDDMAVNEFLAKIMNIIEDTDSVKKEEIEKTVGNVETWKVENDGQGTRTTQCKMQGSMIQNTTLSDLKSDNSDKVMTNGMNSENIIHTEKRKGSKRKYSGMKLGEKEDNGDIDKETLSLMVGDEMIHIEVASDNSDEESDPGIAGSDSKTKSASDVVVNKSHMPSDKSLQAGGKCSNVIQEKLAGYLKSSNKADRLESKRGSTKKPQAPVIDLNAEKEAVKSMYVPSSGVGNPSDLVKMTHVLVLTPENKPNVLANKQSQFGGKAAPVYGLNSQNIPLTVADLMRDKQIRMPAVPLSANSQNKPIKTVADLMRDQIHQQLCMPVVPLSANTISPANRPQLSALSSMLSTPVVSTGAGVVRYPVVAGIPNVRMLMANSIRGQLSLPYASATMPRIVYATGQVPVLTVQPPLLKGSSQILTQLSMPSVVAPVRKDYPAFKFGKPNQKKQNAKNKSTAKETATPKLAKKSQSNNDPVNNVTIVVGRDGIHYNKETGKPFIYPKNEKYVIAGPHGKFYDKETGYEVNVPSSQNLKHIPGAVYLAAGVTFTHQVIRGPRGTKISVKPNPRKSAIVSDVKTKKKRKKQFSKDYFEESNSSDEEFEKLLVSDLEKSSENEESDDPTYDYEKISKHVKAAREKKIPERRASLETNGSDDDVMEVDSDVDAVPVVLGRNAKRAAARRRINYSEPSELIVVSDDSSEDDVQVIEDTQPCKMCNTSEDPSAILLCDKCDGGYHMACLSPPLSLVPLEDWFCPLCEHNMLIESLKEKLEMVKKAHRRHKSTRRRDRISQKTFSINSENILEVERRSCRSRKEVSYNESNYDKMIQKAVKELNNEKKRAKSSDSSDSETTESDTKQMSAKHQQQQQKKLVQKKQHKKRRKGDNRRQGRGDKSGQETEEEEEKRKPRRGGKSGQESEEEEKRRPRRGGKSGQESEEEEKRRPRRGGKSGQESEEEEEEKRRPRRGGKPGQELEEEKRSSSSKNKHKKRKLTSLDDSSGGSGSEYVESVKSDSSDTDGTEPEQEAMEMGGVYFTSSGRKTKNVSYT